MSTANPLSPLAICEACWLVEKTRWEPESMDENGRILMKLTGVGMPQMISQESVEVCCMCGELTVVGIYVFRDPESVPYPEKEDDIFGVVIGMGELEEDYDDMDYDPEDGCG